MNLISKAKLADIVGVTRQAIGDAVKRGVVPTEGEGRRAHIDLDHPDVIAYIQDNSETRTRSKDARKGYRPPSKPREPSQSSPEPEQTVTGLVRVATQSDANLEKTKAQTAKHKADLAVALGKLLVKEMSDKAWGRLHSISVNQFLPLGDRLAPIIAGVFGSTDPELIIKTKELINADVTRALDAVKDIQGEDFAKS